MRSNTPIRLSLAAFAVAACEADPNGVAGGPQSGDTTRAEAESRADGTAAEPQADGDNAARSAGDAALSPELSALEYMQRTEDRASRAADTDAAGKIPACAVCHGPQGGGDPAMGTPRIGGLEEWYIARQLQYFKLGLRGTADEDVHGRYMHGIATLITDDAEIEALAEHFAVLDPAPVPDLVDGDAERGRELYETCAACHGEDGAGVDKLNTPSLIGQSGPYMLRQLAHYRSGLRGRNERDIYGTQMATAVESSLEERRDSVDVVAYIETLEPADSRGPGTRESSQRDRGAPSGEDSEDGE